jgi:hypothetical protein
MTPLGLVMVVTLVLVTVALVAVPYWRAGRDPLEETPGGGSFSQDVDRLLRDLFCLECGMRLERAGQSPCPHCGASRSDAS